MQQPKIIKVIQETKCPICDGNYYICFGINLQTIWSLKKEDIEKIRKTMKEKIENTKFKNEKDKKTVLDYIESTPLSAEEIDSIIESMLDNTNENKDKDSDK